MMVTLNEKCINSSDIFNVLLFSAMQFNILVSCMVLIYTLIRYITALININRNLKNLNLKFWNTVLYYPQNCTATCDTEY